MNSASSSDHSTMGHLTASTQSFEEGELPSRLSLDPQLRRTMDKLDALLGITAGARPNTFSIQPWAQSLPISLPSSETLSTVQPRDVFDAEESDAQTTPGECLQSNQLLTSSAVHATPPLSANVLRASQLDGLIAGLQSVPLATSTVKNASAAPPPESTTAVVQSKRANTHPTPADQAGYESRSSTSSQRLVGSGERQRRVKLEWSTSPQANAADTRPNVAPSSDQGSEATSAIKSEARQDRANKASAKLTDWYFGEGERYQVDVDWLDRCDRCVREGTRCYTAAGSLRRTTSCQNCQFRHWTCTIDGQRVYKKPSSAPKQAKRKEKAELEAAVADDSLAGPSTAAKRHVHLRSQERQTSARAQPRKSGRQSKTAQHRPVYLAASSHQPRYVRSKRTRKPTAETSSVENVGTAREVSSSPESEEEPLANFSKKKEADQLGSSTKPDSTTKDDTRNMQVREVHISVRETQARAPVDASPKGSSESITVTTDPISEVAEPGSSRMPDPRVEQYTLGLIKDIAGTIRRCKARVAQIQDHRTALLVLERPLRVLISDLGKLLVPESTACDGSKVAYWILPQLKEYLQLVLLDCQHARETPNGQELDPAEKLDRQIAALEASETLFDRCLTLISMHIGEESA